MKRSEKIAGRNIIAARKKKSPASEKLHKRSSFFLFANFLFFFCVWFSSAQNTGPKEQNRLVDSLKILLARAHHDSTRCIVLNQLAENAPDGEWEIYNDQLLRLSKSKESVTGSSDAEYKQYRHFYAAALNNLGIIAQIKGDNEHALEYFENSLKIRESIRDKEGVAIALNNIGFIYQNQGHIQKALDCYIRSLKIQEESTDKSGLAETLNKIGNVYSDLGDYRKCIDFFRRSLTMREEIGDKQGLSYSLNNLGFLYSNQGDPEISGNTTASMRSGAKKGLELLLRSLALKEEFGDKQGICATLNNIGAVYEKHGDPDASLNKEEAQKAGLTKAIAYYQRSRKLAEEIKDMKGICYSYSNLGSVYYQQKNYSEALKFIQESMQIALRLGYPLNIKAAARQLAALYKSTGEHKLAYQNLKLYIQMRDSINNEDNRKAGLRSHLKYEYEKKAAAQNAKTAEEKKFISSTLKHRRTQRFFLYGGLALLSVFALFMVSRFRVTRRQKRIIEAQKAIVEEQKELAEKKQREILASIRYAKRIQEVIMTNEHYIRKNLHRLNT